MANIVQNRLSGIQDYFISLEHYKGKWVVTVRYDEKWTTYIPEDASIAVVADDKNEGVWWYYGKTENVSPDDIISLIEETAQTNIDAIKKAELFKQKAIELKAIFSDETVSYDKLQSLKFTLGDTPSPKPLPLAKKSTKQGRAKTEVTQQVVKEKVEATTKEEEDKVLVPVNATDMSDEEINDLRG